MDQIFDPERLGALLGLSADQTRLEGIMEGTPPVLSPIAHYAASWGISDDGYRLEFLTRVPEAAVQNLRYVVGVYEDELDEWLAGPEAEGPAYSEAYIAFSAMRMASDGV